MKCFIGSLAIITILLVSGCVTENKALGMSTATDGFLVRASSNPAMGGTNVLPEVLFSKVCMSYASSPFISDKEKVKCARVFTMAKNRSFFGTVFGIDDNAETMTYIGSPNDSVEDTIKIIKSFGELSNLKTSIK